MKYIVNLVNKRGINKVKSVEASDIKLAQAKAESRYPDWKVARITPDEQQLDYYSLVKELRKYNK
tara:strand:+ start:302 stop:496 length:195 start_codon:yes stop_codon:yes gene_type:complete